MCCPSIPFCSSNFKVSHIRYNLVFSLGRRIPYFGLLDYWRIEVSYLYEMACRYIGPDSKKDRILGQSINYFQEIETLIWQTFTGIHIVGRWPCSEKAFPCSLITQHNTSILRDGTMCLFRFITDEEIHKCTSIRVHCLSTIELCWRQEEMFFPQN